MAHLNYNLHLMWHAFPDGREPPLQIQAMQYPERHQQQQSKSRKRSLDTTISVSKQTQKAFHFQSPSLLPNPNLHEPILSCTAPKHPSTIKPACHFPFVGHRYQPGLPIIKPLFDHKVHSLL